MRVRSVFHLVACGCTAVYVRSVFHLVACGCTAVYVRWFCCRDGSDQNGAMSDGQDSLDGDASHSYDILPDMDYGEYWELWFSSMSNIWTCFICCVWPDGCPAGQKHLMLHANFSAKGLIPVMFMGTIDF